jgi:hypothetical protein
MANKYAPIWEALKRDGHVTLAIPVPLQKRVLKGLINLKDRDTAFKLLAAEQKKRYILKPLAEAARVRIFLRTYDDTSALTVTDL